MAQRFKGRKSLRESKLESHAASTYYAVMAGKPPPPPPDVKPKRAAPVPSGKKLESAVNDEIYDAVRAFGRAELWRNNRGVAIYGAQHVRYGVGPNGSSDWIGYRKTIITADMVGKDFAQFTAIEAKRPGEKPDEDQRKFIARVNADGGCAGWADSAEKAIAILRRW